ncbi:ArnT family glycosyltransferase [Desulfoferrobacter suflitae]|uniref:ArnT family glycosyltransferase n=1 Tax=Desulfoferrobacter suflitae TaxID=2865782 RepID=UPI00216493E6|nr:glycosyltransferase family 39 protein [Desulfoferrobacter suflitae]MCK8603857.1 glycosyltransferase family 39 protein [Desulfoferrobacter suflitae]
MHSLQHMNWTHEETKRVARASLTALAVCVPSLIWQNIPTRDSSLYALLSLEFSSGNFENAFSPDLSPLLTTVGGSINYFVGHPFLANQIASVLLFLPGVPGTYLLARELRGAKVAWLASILYAVCPYTIELATSGGVDSGKLALLPWLAWAALKWCRSERLIWGLWLGLIGGLLSYSRGEGLLFSVSALVVCAASWVYSRYTSRNIRPIVRPLTSFLAASVTMALVISPWLWFEQRQTGYLVTHPSQIRIHQLLDGVKGSLIREASASSLDETTGGGTASGIQAVVQQQSEDLYRDVPWLKNIEKSVKGLYMPYLLLVVLAVVRHFTGAASLSGKDFFPFIFIGLNFAIFFPTNICAARYFQPLIPLHLHLTALGFIAVGDILSNRMHFSPKRIQCLAIVSCVVLALLAQKECDTFKSKKKIGEARALQQMGQWISDNRQKFPFYGTLSNSRAFHNGRFPVILAPDFRICYYALSDCVIFPRDHDLPPEWIVDLCVQNKVSLIFYTNLIKEVNPKFDAYWPTDPAFRPIAVASDHLASKYGFRILMFDREKAGGVALEP